MDKKGSMRMSHRVTINMIADQEISIMGKNINIHDIDTIIVNDDGQIVETWLKKEEVRE